MSETNGDQHMVEAVPAGSQQQDAPAPFKNFQFSPKFDKNNVKAFITQISLAFEAQSVPEAKRGRYMLLALPAKTLYACLVKLGITTEAAQLDPASWPEESLNFTSVRDALLKLHLQSTKTDNAKLEELMALRVNMSSGGHHAFLLKAEELANSMQIPPAWQTVSLCIAKGSHREFRPLIEYNQGVTWPSYDLFRENYLNQVPGYEAHFNSRQSSKPAATTPTGPHSPGKKGPKGPARGIVKPSHRHAHMTCNRCGQPGHLPHWIDRNTGKHLCPKWEEVSISRSNIAHSRTSAASHRLPIAVGRAKRRLLVSAVCAAQLHESFSLNRAAAAAAKATYSTAACMPSSCSDDDVLAAAGQLSARQVRFAAYQACLPHADLLSASVTRSSFADNLMSALLPTYVGCAAIKEVNLSCAAFQAADGLAAQLQLAAASPPVCTPVATASPRVSATAPAPARTVPSDEAIHKPVGGSEASMPEHNPVAADVFQRIQQELAYPCTADAYASRHSARCATYYTPTACPFVNPSGNDCNVYWLHCPKDIQYEYLALYSRAKTLNPSIGICVLLPFKLPVTHLHAIKGFKLLHTYGRNTLLFANPHTGATVRSKCSLALWYDPPVRDQTKTTDTQESMPHSAADSVPLKPRLQVSGILAGIRTLALLDTGAADHNFISADFCQQHGIKTSTVSDPFRAIGIQGGTAMVTSCAKLTLKLASFTCHPVFFVLSLPPAASFQVILGDAWLKSHKAVLDYNTDTCVLHHCGRRHVIPFAVLHGATSSAVSQHAHVPDAVAVNCAAAAESSDAAVPSAQSSTSAPAAPCVIGYAQAKRLLRGEVWHAMVVVRSQHTETIVLPVTSTVHVTDAPSSPELLSADQVQEIVSFYPDVFTDAPPYGGSQIQLDTEVIPLEPGTAPILRPMFRYSPAELELMEQRIAELIGLGYIQPSASPFGAPVLFVKKPRSTELRMVVDYRVLNKLTKRNGFPLPRVDMLFDHLAGSAVYSLIDLRNAYHQCKLLPSDVPRTAFRTPFGHYEFLTLSFGLMNAPAAFQSVMNKIFSKLLYKHCLVYLDDILVFSKSAADHAIHLKAVLDVLQANKLTVALHKCTLNQASVLFLGHIISSKGVATDPAKIAAMQQFPVPTDVSRVRSFLGTTNYFRRFVRKYAEIVRPLTNLLRHDAAFVWSSACQTAFDRIKELLTSAPVLALPDWRSHKPFDMVCDASYEGVGGVLLQDGRPIAFESRKLIPAEAHYSPTELEMLAVVHCCKVWRCYIEGRDVRVYTDHKPNITFDTVNMANRRHARWLDALQGHRLTWNYLKGGQNIADSLSRNPVELDTTADVPMTLVCTVHSNPETTHHLSASQSFLAAVRSGYAVDPWFQDPANTAQLRQHDDLYYKDNALVLPADAALHRMAIAECHDPPYVGHVGNTKTLAVLRRYFWWPVGMAAAVRHYVATCDSCQRNKPSNHKPIGLLRPLPVPSDTWQSVGMDMVTDLPLTPDGYDSIIVFVDRLSKMVRLAPCLKSTTAEQFAELFYSNVFRSHGLPEELVHDRAPIWTSKFWQAFEKLLHISSAMTSGYRPQSNGQTERVNRIMEDMLRHYIDASQTNWAVLLPLVEFAVNDSYHESIQTTPFEVNYGKRPNLPLDNILRGEGRVSTNCDSAAERAEYIFAAVKKAKSAMQAAQQRQKFVADARRQSAEFHVDDMVLLSTSNIKLKFKGTPKLLPKWIGPFKVTSVINSVAYKLELPSSLKLHNVFHISLLKPYKNRADGGQVNPPPPPVLIDGDFEYEVESILSHRFVRNKTEFLVKWLGYGPEHNTWEPEANCANCPDKLSDYWERVKSQQSSALRAAGKRSRKRKAVNSDTAVSAGVGTRRSKRLKS